MCKRCDEDGFVRKRDFMQDKGGPEEMPHRKKGGKPRKREKSDHKHIYVMEVRHEPAYFEGKFHVVHVWACAEFDCTKVKKRKTIMQRTRNGRWFEYLYVDKNGNPC